MTVTAQAAPTKALPFMHVAVKGRIDASRRYDKYRYTRVITPVPDEYSRPQVIEVRHRQSLGSVGDEITFVGVLGGYTRKPYKSIDQETGDVTMVTPVDLTLDLVE